MITTERLLLRPFADDDASRVESLAGDKAVAAMTGNIPHPYPPGAAIGWIKHTRGLICAGLIAQRAVVVKDTGLLVGCISLKRNEVGSSEAELAYWFGVPYWGRGFATEACLAFVDEVAREWRLNTVWAGVLPDNVRSMRVLEKLGMSSNDAYEVTRGEDRVHLLRYAVARAASAAHGGE